MSSSDQPAICQYLPKSQKKHHTLFLLLPRIENISRSTHVHDSEHLIFHQQCFLLRHAPKILTDRDDVPPQNSPNSTPTVPRCEGRIDTTPIYSPRWARHARATSPVRASSSFHCPHSIHPKTSRSLLYVLLPSIQMPKRTMLTPHVYVSERCLPVKDIVDTDMVTEMRLNLDILLLRSSKLTPVTMVCKSSRNSSCIPLNGEEDV